MPRRPTSYTLQTPTLRRWLSERFPLVNQPGGTTVIPIIDNFYLDMNGIIHNCTHGNNPDVKLTEEEMVLRIFTYLDKLFHIVKPQKLIFMAIDGGCQRLLCCAVPLQNLDPVHLTEEPLLLPLPLLTQACPPAPN